jgi:hypothetical protein
MCDGDLGECRSWDCDECDMEYDARCDFSCSNNAFCVRGACQDPDDPEMCEAWSWSPSMCAGGKVCGDDGFCAAAASEAPPVRPAAVPTPTPTPTAPPAVSTKPAAVAALAPAAAKPASAGFAGAPLGALVAAVAALAM